VTVREAEALTLFPAFDLPGVLEMRWRSTGGKCREVVSSNLLDTNARPEWRMNSSAGVILFGMLAGDAVDSSGCCSSR
jgi:hypothetical protein